MATLPDPFSRRDVRDEFHNEVLRRQQYEDFERQRAAELRAQQEAKQRAEQHEQQRQMHPHQVAAAQNSNVAAEQAIRDNQIKLDEAELLRTAQGDISGWLSHQTPQGQQPYARSFYDAPAEARAHFQRAYPTIPVSQTANIWNNNVRAVTGDAMAGVPKVESEYPIERTIQTNEKGESQVTQAEKAPQVRQTANVPEGAMTKLVTAQKSYAKLGKLREAYNKVRDGWLTGQKWGAVPAGIKSNIESVLGKKEYKDFNALLNDILVDMAKGVGGDTGVLSDPDIERWKSTMPNVNQDPATADFLFDKMENDIRGAYNQIHDMYGRVYYMGDIPRLDTSVNTSAKPVKPVAPGKITPPKAPVRPVIQPRGQRAAVAPVEVPSIEALTPDLPPGRYKVKGSPTVYVRE